MLLISEEFTVALLAKTRVKISVLWAIGQCPKSNIATGLHYTSLVTQTASRIDQKLNASRSIVELFPVVNILKLYSKIRLQSLYLVHLPKLTANSTSLK